MKSNTNAPIIFFTSVSLGMVASVFGQPVLTEQPMNQTASLSANATFGVTATGDAPLSYQWRWNTNDLAGQTDRTLILTNLQLTHLGQYSVVVSNSSGSVTSRMAGLGLYITLAPRFDPALSISRWDGGIAVRWEGNARLEQALSVTGPWQSLSATSPFTNSSVDAVAFFRVRHPNPRPVRVYLPSSYDAQSPAPLIIALHGYTWSGTRIEDYLQLQPLAESRGFLYCYPDGTVDQSGNRFWNATDACCDFFDTGTDDAGYLRAVIEEIGRELAVDRKRIHLIGHSNGGFMAYRMACQSADLIAGIASLAGTTFLDPGRCDPFQPVNILNIHGTSDGIILYSGGVNAAAYPGAQQTVQTWAGYNGALDPVTESGRSMDLVLNLPGLDTVITRYTNYLPGGAVELWTINGGSHLPTLSPEFSPRVIDWLLAHPKP